MNTSKALNFVLAAALIATISYSFKPSTGVNILGYDVSNGSIVTNPDDTWTVSVSPAGGYARINYKSPEMDKKVFSAFKIGASFVLPSNFYTSMKDGFRILTTDNYPTTINGVRVGAKDLGSTEFNEWRCGAFFWKGDNLIHVRCEHETQGSFELWKSSAPLPVGPHTIEFSGDMSAPAPWEFKIDGVVVASGNKQLCMPELLASECVITRIRAGIDGGGPGVTLTINSFSVDELIAGATPVPLSATNTPASNMTVTISTNTPKAASSTPVPVTATRTVTATPAIVPTVCELSTHYMICTR